MNKKKILYVLGGNSSANGMSAVITQKMNYLATHTDYELTALLTESLNNPMCYPLHETIKVINFNINFDELDTLPIYKKIWRYKKKLKEYKQKFTNLLMEVKYDIVVSAMRREINFLTDIKDGSKKVGELHFCRVVYRVFNASFLPRLVNEYITRLWQEKLIKQIKRLDNFVVLSQEDANAWGNISNMVVIHNPIKEYPSITSSCENKKVIAVGRYTWQKGFDMLIKAWGLVDMKHPDWELHIYGAGDNNAYQELAGQGVFCHEAVKDIYEKYRESSIFAFSSRYEGFALVMAEAMGSGLPIVAFACPCGPKDIITNDGILVEPGNIEEFADGLCKLIEDETLRKEMGKNGHLNMRRFEETAIMQKWIDLFDNLCNS